MRYPLWLSRLLISVVLFFNLQCAVAFLFWPAAYAGGFELQGAAGNALIQGIGLLFVMWNVPYAVAVSHPLRQQVSLFEAAAMQTIGFLGETSLALLLPAGHEALRASVGRFMLFDGGGLVLLLLAIWITTRPVRQGAPGSISGKI